MGTRMEGMTKNSPKCLVELKTGETILERQLNQLKQAGVHDIIITTGYGSDQIEKCVFEKFQDMNIEFVYNQDFKITNYIYSLYLIKKDLEDDIILMHGDMVLESEVLNTLVQRNLSSVVVSSTIPLPEKDFKAVQYHDTISAIGIEYFDNAYACQPVYYMKREDWKAWLNQIKVFCENKDTKCYAEKALNPLLEKREIKLYPHDIKNLLCQEIDTPIDLETVNKRL